MLKTMALSDIEAKLTGENVATETFSRFATQYVLHQIRAISAS